MKSVSNFAAFVLVPACGVFFLWWGLAKIVDGGALSGAIASIFALAAFGFSAQWAVMRFMADPRGDFDSVGTTIRPRKLFDVLSLFWMGAAVLAAALFVTFAPFGYVDIPTYRSSTPWMMVFILLTGLATLWRMIAHGGDCYLRLTPDRCEVWNGPWLAFRRANWEDIEQIQDHPLRRKLRGRELVVLALPEGRSATLLSDCVTDNSQALRDWVRFYWQHPEYRDELVDGRGLQRLDDQKFTVE